MTNKVIELNQKELNAISGGWSSEDTWRSLGSAMGSVIGTGITVLFYATTFFVIPAGGGAAAHAGAQLGRSGRLVVAGIFLGGALLTTAFTAAGGVIGAVANKIYYGNSDA